MPVEVSLITVGSCRQREWFATRARGGRWLTFPALVACIRHPAIGVILFDTGYGRALSDSTTLAARLYRRALPFQLPAADELPAQLNRLGLSPSDIDLVFLSHFHPDHIGALREIPAAPILHSAAALRVLTAASGYRRSRAVFLPELMPDDFTSRALAIEDLPRVPLGPEWQPFGEAFDVAGDGSLLAVSLPGHAIGQYGLICQLSDKRVLFLVADAAWVRPNFADLAVPAWPVRFLLADRAAFAETLRSLHALCIARPEITLIPSHCEASIRAFQDG